MEFLHGGDHVGHVLDHVDGAQLVERVIAERIGKAIEVDKNVGAGARVAIDSDRTRVLVDSAADVEGQARPMFSRHSSSVSMAKSAWSRVRTSGGQRRMLLGPAPRTSRPR